jgi:agmatine deiminase
MSPSPRELGFRFPAEWERQAATWVTWPHNPATWPHCFEEATVEFAGMVAAIAADQVCNVIARSTRHNAIWEQLSKHGDCSKVKLWDWPTNDSWVRDYGPTFVVRRTDSGNELAAVDFTYNGWGEKYPPFNDDQKIAARIAEQVGVPRFAAPLILEGGAIETDGQGRLMTTRFCALNPNRNPGRSESEVEQTLRDYLGVQQIWWLPGRPIVGDDTDGHIDQIARFTPANRIVIATCADPGLEDFEPAAENLQALRSLVAADSKAWEIVPLPMPQPFEMDGQTLPASYTNFYITDRSVLVPQFSDPNDSIALERLRVCFPNHQIKPLPSKFLADGLGSFHCLTQQQPS